jgi:MFS family permease
LVLATILSYTDRQILSLLVDPIRDELRITDTQVALLMGTAFALVYGVAGVPLGWLADRMCRRNLIVAGILFWSIGTVCCGISQNFAQFFCARMLVGVGEAVLTPASISMISDSFPEHRRGTATSVFLMGMSMGAGGAIAFGGLILHWVQNGVLSQEYLEHLAPWRVVLVLLGTLGLIPGAMSATLREPQRQHRQEPTSADPTENVTDAFDWKVLVALMPLLLGIGIASLVDNAVFAWAPSAFVRGFAMSADRVGPLLGTLLMLSGGAGMLAGGLLSDYARKRSGRSGRISVAFAAAALTVPVTALIMSDDFGIVLAGVTLYALLACIAESAGMLTLLDSVPNHRHGLVTALSFFLNVALGAGVGPLTVTLVADHVSQTGRWLGFAIFLVAGSGFILVSSFFFKHFLTARSDLRVPV